MVGAGDGEGVGAFMGGEVDQRELSGVVAGPGLHLADHFQLPGWQRFDALHPAGVLLSLADAAGQRVERAAGADQHQRGQQPAHRLRPHLGRHQDQAVEGACQVERGEQLVQLAPEAIGHGAQQRQDHHGQHRPGAHSPTSLASETSGSLPPPPLLMRGVTQARASISLGDSLISQ